MPSDGITKATGVLAIVTFFLVLVTGYYAWQTYRLVEHESMRWLSETRPYLEVRFISWGEGAQGPRLEIFNVGQWAAARVRFENGGLHWVDASANTQGSMTLGPAGHPRKQVYFPGVPSKSPGKSITEHNWSTEFRVRYNDVQGGREFADKWEFRVKDGKPFLLKLNMTELQKMLLPSEDYVIQQPSGPGS